MTGTIPDTGDTLIIPATETYSDGTVVNWDQPPATGGAEVEYPAPVITLTGTSTSGHGSGDAVEFWNPIGWTLMSSRCRWRDSPSPALHH